MVTDNGGDGSDSKEDKVAKKNSEVSCWNCFNNVTAEKDGDTVTLPKIRQETRTKYRLYSFIASQISKPKAMPLAQKVSENYAIGKKIEKKIVEKAKKEQKEGKKNLSSPVSKTSTKINHNISETDEESSATETKTSDEGPYEYDRGISEYIKEYNLFEAYKTIRRKTPTPNSTLQRSQSLNYSNLSKNDTYNSVDNTDSQSLSYNKLEIVHPRIIVKKVYESPKIHITSNTYITKSEENLLSSVNIPQSSTNSSLSRNDSTSSRTSLGLNSSIRRSLSKNVLDKKEKLLSRIGEKTVSSGHINMSPMKSPTPTAFQNKSGGYVDNIMQTVQIETSTPISKRRIHVSGNNHLDSLNIEAPKKQNDIESIIEGIQKITLENKEQVIVDKVEISSANGSESGYSGSSTRDFNEPEFTGTNAASKRSIESGIETESPQLSNKSPRPIFKTSLPVIPSRRRSNIMSSTKSLSVDAGDEVKKPVKQLRWSTLLPSEPGMYNGMIKIKKTLAVLQSIVIKKYISLI